MARSFSTATTVLIAGLIATASALPAAGGKRHESRDGLGSPGYVVTYSRFGGGRVTGPVRYTAVGREVRLPGGTWEPCKRSCSETLRASTVDYWDSHGPNAVATECGIFGCLQLHDPR